MNNEIKEPIPEESNNATTQPTPESNESVASPSPLSEEETIQGDNTPSKATVTVREKKGATNFLTSKWAMISCLLLVGVGALAWFFINKLSKESEYQSNLKEFVLESGKASMTSVYICEDLRSIWHDYIFKDKYYFINSSGSFTNNSYNGDEYCSSFSDAVNRKIRWNERNLPSTLTEPYKKAKELYKELTPPPSKYKDIHVYVKQMFKAMEKLHELSIDPTGNLSTYSSNCNSAVEEYTSALSDLTNESNIDFSKVDSKTE